MLQSAFSYGSLAFGRPGDFGRLLPVPKVNLENRLYPLTKILDEHCVCAKVPDTVAPQTFLKTLSM